MGGFNLSAWGIKHPQLIVFLILAIGLAGAFAYARLGRAEDPAFTIKVAVVTAQWPGATTEEMQSQVADRIEKKLQELPWIDKIDTYSKPSFSAISLSFRNSTPPRDVPLLFLALRKKMADVLPDLPAGVIGPSVNDDFGDVNSVLYTVTGDGASYAQLKDVAEAFRKRLQRVPDVTKVDLYGDQPERIFVEFSHAKLATLGVPLQALFDSIGRQNALTSAGEFQTDAQRLPLRVTGAQKGAEAVAETPVSANGQTFRLGDVANVTHGYKDPPSWLIRAEGQPALEVGVVMQRGGNILALGKALDATLAEFESELPRGVTIARIADQPEVVDKAVYEFTRSFVEALAIVLAVSFLSLGWRAGFVVATSVPLVLAIVFIAMALMGLDLQRVTLGALIIALGLLVDDAIIATEMVVVKLEQGWSRERAASFAWTSTAFPMLTGTLVTAAGFMPIGLANSAVGEYTGGIFWVVGIALAASWVVAVLFTPFLGYKLLPHYGGHLRDETAIYATRFYRAFRRALEFCVSHPILIVAVAAALARPWPQPVQQGPAAVLSPVGAAGALLRTEARRRLLDPGDRNGRARSRGPDRGRSRRALVHVLYRPELAALLARAPAGAAERSLRPDRDRRPRHGGARTHQGADRSCGRQGRAEPGAGAARPVQFRAAGRLSRAVPGRRREARRDPGRRRAGARRHARRSEAHRSASQLGREDAFGPARSRSGARPRARPDARRTSPRRCRRWSAG